MRPSAGLRAALASAFGLGMGACASGPGYLAEDDAPQSLYGSYLAAQYAGRAQDLDASAELYAEALAFDPDSAFLSHRAFFAALMAGDFDRADRAADRALDSPETTQIAELYRRASLLGRRGGDAPPSDRVYGPFALLVSDILSDWHEIGRRREPGRASEFRLGAEVAVPPYQLIHEALMAERDGRTGEADQAYRRAAAEMPQLRAFIAVQHGAMLERTGARAEAAGLYRTLVNQDGGSEPDVAAALARVQSGGAAPRFPGPREAAARALFAPAALIANQAALEYAALYLRMIQRLDPEFDRNLYTLGQMLEALNLHGNAQAAYAAIDPAAPFHERAEINRIWLGFQAGEELAAIDAARALVQTRPSIQGRLLLADLLRYSGQCAEAGEIYRTVIETERARETAVNWRYVFYAGVCTEMEDGWPAAAPWFEQALALAPDEPLVLNHVGYNLIVEGAELDRGFALVERAAELDPENGAIIDSLGWGHFKQGRVEEAVRWLEQAVSLSPDSATINWHLGDAYAAAGRTLEARFQWRRALELELDPGEQALIERRLALGLDAGPPDLP